MIFSTKIHPRFILKELTNVEGSLELLEYHQMWLVLKLVMEEFSYQNTLQITILKLDVMNYLIWSRSALLSIQNRGLYRYLTREFKKPQISGPLHDKWIAENSLVMSWNRQIHKLVMMLKVYELVKSWKQGKKTLAEYYTDLRALWQEIDSYEDFQADWVPDSEKYKSKVDKLRVSIS